MSRYENETTFLNSDPGYRTVFSSRFSGTSLKQFGTFNKIKFPSDEKLQEISFESIVWKSTDRFWKLASEHYNDPELWWIIALFNQVVIEADVPIGKIVHIPNLSSAKEALGFA